MHNLQQRQQSDHLKEKGLATQKKNILIIKEKQTELKINDATKNEMGLI